MAKDMWPVKSCMQGLYNISWMAVFTNLVCYNRSVRAHTLVDTLVEGVHFMECLCRCRGQSSGLRSTFVCSTSWMSSAHIEDYQQLSLQSSSSIMITLVVFQMSKTCHGLWDHALFLLQLCYLTYWLAQEMWVSGFAASPRLGSSCEGP